MIYAIKWTTKFKKSYKLAQKRGLDIALLKSILYKIQHGEKLEEKYKDHELKGKFKGFRECHLSPDWLLIYLIEDDILTLTVVDTGSHADLFGM
ncbi:MAG: type II toxin-antitoxin system YafQ family toxin [Eubacterium sp.]